MKTITVDLITEKINIFRQSLQKCKTGDFDSAEFEDGYNLAIKISLQAFDVYFKSIESLIKEMPEIL